MTLLELIEKDFKQALREKKAEELEVLRGLKTALHNKEIELRSKKQELTDQDCLEIIRKEVKKRREAIELFEKGARPDLVAKEKNEQNILNKYLPKELSDDKIREVVLEVIKKLGTSDKQDFGKVMGMAMSRLKGQAEGSRISQIVRAFYEKT